MKSIFPGQSEHEEILIFVRRHWMPFVLWLVSIGIMLVIPIVAGLLLFASGSVWVFESQRLAYVSLGLGVYLLLVNAIFFTAWVEQYLDVAIITNGRLVHVRQIGLFNRRVAELGMDRVQDVSAQMNGYLQSIFQFGTVIVETAGGAPDFVIRNIAKPHVVANTILMIHDQTSNRESKNSDVLPATVKVLDQTMMQQAIAEHIPSVAPPSDFDQEQLQEDLFSQALEAQETIEASEQSMTILEPTTKQLAPNRLPPSWRNGTQSQSDVGRGEVIPIEPL